MMPNVLNKQYLTWQALVYNKTFIGRSIDKHINVFTYVCLWVYFK